MTKGFCMKVAVIGSRSIKIDSIEIYLPQKISELVSGGAKGVDECVKKYAMKNDIKLTEFLPDYKRYLRGAPLKRNIEIIEYADLVIAIWDGNSKGTEFVINQCKKRKKTVVVYILKNG